MSAKKDCQKYLKLLSAVLLYFKLKGELETYTSSFKCSACNVVRAVL